MRFYRLAVQIMWMDSGLQNNLLRLQMNTIITTYHAHFFVFVCVRFKASGIEMELKARL